MLHPAISDVFKFLYVMLKEDFNGNRLVVTAAMFCARSIHHASIKTSASMNHRDLRGNGLNA